MLWKKGKVKKLKGDGKCRDGAGDSKQEVGTGLIEARVVRR